MATKTESTSKGMADGKPPPWANLRFSIMSSSKRVPIGDCNNSRQPDRAAETGNTYRDSIETPTANLGFTVRRARKSVGK